MSSTTTITTDRKSARNLLKQTNYDKLLIQRNGNKVTMKITAPKLCDMEAVIQAKSRQPRTSKNENRKED